MRTSGLLWFGIEQAFISPPVARVGCFSFLYVKRRESPTPIWPFALYALIFPRAAYCPYEYLLRARASFGALSRVRTAPGQRDQQGPSARGALDRRGGLR